MDQEHIDGLLARYLALLDEYSRLRQDLSRHLSNVYQNIARANFSAERGLRYGGDHYDQRMQALRLVGITLQDGAVPQFAVVETPNQAAPKDDGSEAAPESATGDKGAGEKGTGEKDDDSSANPKPKPKPKPKSKDPLRWFGVLSPMTLRQAQQDAIAAVEQTIPRLVSVNAEMLSVEIDIRRARKKRAKSGAAQSKVPQQPADAAEDTTSAAQAQAQTQTQT